MEICCTKSPGEPVSRLYPYDDTAQASTGVMARFGGSLGTPEEHAHFGTIDVLGGFCGALATVLALVDRRRGGASRVARSSLAAAGQLIQIPFMYDHDEREPFNEPSGRAVKGEHALYRLYEAKDGWFFLAARLCMQEQLSNLSEFADIGSVTENELEAYLAERFRHQPVNYWTEKLLELDLGSHKADSTTHVRDHHLVPESAADPDLANSTMLFIRHDNHPSGYVVDLVAPNAIRMQRSSIEIPSAAPKYGAHTRQILGEFGFCDRGITQLLAEGSVSEAWTYGEEYLPD